LATISPGQKTWIEGLKLPVLMRLANEADFGKDRIGVVDFVDNRVIATTGTVRMRGVFDNPKGTLKAGLFVRIRLPIGTKYPSMLIADEAIQSDQERKYVWLVNAKDEVEYRSVKLGQSLGELRAIKKPEAGKEGKEGLAEGERFIVSGMQRVRKGTAVDPDVQPPPVSPGSPLVRLLAEGKKQ
jgi:multidrug efflux system membrane fusion protein